MRIRSALVTLLCSLLSCSPGEAGDAASPRATINSFIRKMTEAGKKPNRLIKEKSPYLLQHAFNPVDWYPWGDEAFQSARAEDKPIFLSIGYSTCHWCHVMEHESFENDSIAAIMNQYFICIKVDREERPDIDRIYMAALQGMGEGGGWPMSMFLTPDLKPFFGGTYFPPENRYGRIGFPDLLRRIHELWTTQRDRVVTSANGVTDFLTRISSGSRGGDSLPDSLLHTCFEQAKKAYEPGFGGFGEGPKFPRPVVFNFLLRYYYRTGNDEALEMTEHSLAEMADGGVYDHLGGGFHRYSVDGEWRVPHFEKMLYDQAQTVISYLELYQITKKEAYAEVARDILRYVRRDMTDKRGGFYSAEDADSPRPEHPEEQGEGAFYVWTQSEIDEILNAKEAAAFSAVYGVKRGGNALTDPQNEFTGRNILYRAREVSAVAEEMGISVVQVGTLLDQSRTKLLAVRSNRPRPHLDDKILTSWNGLMISAFARAYQVLNDPKYLQSAEQAAGFIVSTLYDGKTGILQRRYRDGEGGLEAHLDDYSFFAQGLLDLYEASFEIRWLELSLEIMKEAVVRFYDMEHGGFFDTSGEDRSVLVRMKEVYDGAEPAGNSVAMLNLLRLSSMTDNTEWRQLAERGFGYFADGLQHRPFAMPQMVAAFDFSRQKTKQVILVGTREDPTTSKFLRALHGRFLPAKIILLVEQGGEEDPMAQTLPFAANLVRIDNQVTAYVCEEYVCQLPTNTVTTFEKILGETEGRNQ